MADAEGLCLLCFTSRIAVRCLPCGHALACESCTVTYVLTQLREGRRPLRCLHGCGAVVAELSHEIAESSPTASIEIYNPEAGGRHSSQPIEVFLLDRCCRPDTSSLPNLASEALQLWYRGEEDDLRASVFAAVESGDIDRLRFAVASGAPVDAVNEDGLAPLHIACQLGHMSCVQFLHAQGQPVDAIANGPSASGLKVAPSPPLSVRLLQRAWGRSRLNSFLAVLLLCACSPPSLV